MILYTFSLLTTFINVIKVAVQIILYTFSLLTTFVNVIKGAVQMLLYTFWESRLTTFVIISIIMQNMLI